MDDLIVILNIKLKLKYSRFDRIKQNFFLIIFNFSLNNVDTISSYITITPYITKKFFIKMWDYGSWIYIF